MEDIIMKFNRVIGWVVAESKQEAIEALEKMLDDARQCDDGATLINMHFLKEELVDESET